MQLEQRSEDPGGSRGKMNVTRESIVSIGSIFKLEAHLAKKTIKY